MIISETRQNNLLTVIAVLSGGSPAAFCRDFDFSPAYIGQLLMSPEMKTSRNMGSTTARSIEAALGLAHGSMDSLLSESDVLTTTESTGFATANTKPIIDTSGAGAVYRYAILKFMPNELRGEFVNVGIVVFLENSVDVRTFPNLAKIAALDPDYKGSFVMDYEKHIGGFFTEGASVLSRHAILSEFPCVSASRLGYFIAGNSVNYEHEINKILAAQVLSPQDNQGVMVSAPTLNTDNLQSNHMLTVSKIRQVNLKALADDHNGIGKLASIIDRSPSQISQWINASPDSKTGKPRVISNRSARRIEKALNLTVGWLDHQHQSTPLVKPTHE